MAALIVDHSTLVSWVRRLTTPGPESVKPPSAMIIVLELGFGPIWFGVLVLKMIEIGLITPPVGINAFIISGATGAKTERVFRYLTPFVVLDLALTALYFAVPEFILWLPRIAGVH